MKTQLPKTLLFISAVACFLSQNAVAQTAPNISYTTPQSLTINVALPSAISPANSGDPVPAAIYGTVSTFAGSTTGATGTTNATGTNARFNGTRGVAITTSGVFYIADGGNNQIRRITSTGDVTLFAGNAGGAAGSTNSPTGTSASFSNPLGITTDNTNLYVADYGNNQIRKITSAGAVTLLAGSSAGTTGLANNTTGTSATFNQPVALAYDATTNSLFVSDFTNNQIRKISLAGNNAVTLFAGSATGAAGSTDGTGSGASFNGPNGIAVDASGNVYVADQNNNMIRKITPGGAVTTLAGSTATGSADGTGTAASFTTPRSLTNDLSGNLYISDSENQIIRRVSPTGVVVTIAGLVGNTGTTDGVSNAARFTTPRGLDIDPITGNLFIADFGNNSIRKIITTGYTISPALPAGLTFNVTNGQITGTPTALSTATNYTITAYNANGSSTTTLNLAVVNLITVTDANAAANNVTQGTLRPGQTNIVFFGFGVKANSAITISNFNIYNTYNQSPAQAYFNNGKIYRSTSSTFSFATAQLISGPNVNFGYDQGSGINISNLSESLTSSGSPTYYFIVGDFNLGYYGTLPATSQFQFTSGQSNPIILSSPSYTNYSLSNNPTTISSANYPLNIATTTTSANNGALTVSPLSFGQTGIILFSFKLDVAGVINVNQFDIPSNISVNPYFQNGKLYRSTTANFTDAQLTAASVAFNGTNTAISNFTDAMNSFNGTGTYYYFLVGDLTNPNAGTGPLNFNLASSTAFLTQSNPYRQFNPSSNVTGSTFNVSPTFVWVGGASGQTTNFNLAANYRTPLNNSVSGNPTTTSAIYIPAVFQGNAVTTAPALTASINVASVTFDGANPPALALNNNTLTVTNKINLTPNTNASITGTVGGSATLTLTNTSASTLNSGSIFNISGLTLSNAGVFNMESTSALNLTGNANASNSGTFTLKSDANGSARIGQLTGTSTISGNFAVQRYFTGGSASSRGYRLMSSPVSVASNNRILPNLTYVSANAYVTGTGGPSNGFDVAGNPTFYFYRENMAPNNTSFLSSNFRGVKTINTTSSFTIDNDAGNFGLPAGNGFLFFFRGNRASNATTNTAAIAQTATFTSTGYLNQKDVTVNHWTTGNNGLLYTTATANTAVRGYNLVGNPYASSINWETYNAGGIVGTGLSNTIRIYNPTTKNYTTYIKGNGGNGTNYNGPNGTANIIPSGQGFFVQANAAGPTLTFTEAAKVANQVTSATLLMSTSVTDVAEPLKLLRVQIYKDSLNREDALVFLKNTAKDVFVEDEDAEYLRGNNTVTMSTRSADKKNLAINAIPLPKKIQTVLLLNANITASGLYQINLTEAKNIPALYEVYLKDALKKDSLDILTNKTYNFNATAGDSTTFGTKRFSLVIRQKVSMALKLLDFAATKVTVGAQLSWITENESNYTNFTVERSTDGGKTFEVIGGLQSSALGKYILMDKGPVIGQNQYRLKQDDINGTITYSKVVTLMYTVKPADITVNNITVYPNPATSFINVGIVPQSNATSYNIRITNGVGFVVRSVTTAQTNWQDNISNLLPGTYFVQVTNNNTKALVGNGRFIKN